MLTRRKFIQLSTALAAFATVEIPAEEKRAISIILAPSNLGLRPPRTGHQPGTWRAPATLMKAGLAKAIGTHRVVPLARPDYSFDKQPGTQLRNGQSIRHFSLKLADAVGRVLQSGGFPLVVGGDCSVLLGGLYGLRRSGGRGLVHVDGHSDFYLMSDRDAGHLGAVAGMDLALASGRGESLLTEWPEIGVLAKDQDIVQIGERESESDRDTIPETSIAQITVQRGLADGIEATVTAAVNKLKASDIARAWLHVDLDVLDENVMAAVDSPGSPGLNFDQLADLVHGLCSSGRIAGVDFAIYDPEIDYGFKYAERIVQSIARGVGGNASRA